MAPKHKRKKRQKEVLESSPQIPVEASSSQPVAKYEVPVGQPKSSWRADARTATTSPSKIGTTKANEGLSSTLSSSSTSIINLQHQHFPKKFLTVTDGSLYDTVLREHYSNFCLRPAAQIQQPPDFHANAHAALEQLRDSGYYQYDMVMAGGQILSRTFVQRTLVGEPGITYKYLGLRLFAHAWSGPDASNVFKGIFRMNQDMIRMTKEHLKQHDSQRGRQPQSIGGGSCEYNLTLINYMEPSSEALLRDEEFYGMGPTSVSWHADSSLQDLSSIGVYHTLPTSKATKKTWDWKIALRLNPPEKNDHPNYALKKSATLTSRPSTTSTTLPHESCRHEDNEDDAKVAVPPVVIPTKSGDAYFLLREMNHTHQHMVLAGSTAKRISSTHRVAVVATDTYEYIRQRCSTALTTTKVELKKQNPTSTNETEKINTAAILSAQAVLTEVEFEWIAQYWIQGAQHDVQHVWWQAPMWALEQAWAAMEKLTFKIYTHLLTLDSPSRGLLKGMIAALTMRLEWRMKWDERRADKIYKRRISRPFQPVEHPLFTANDPKRLPKDLSKAITALTLKLSLLKDSVRKGETEHSVFRQTDEEKKLSLHKRNSLFTFQGASMPKKKQRR